MTGFTFSDYIQQTLQEKEAPKVSSSGIGGNGDEAVKALCQELVSENRLRHYQMEQQERIIKILNEKVEALELHRATQLGQDKIVGFMVGAIVLSLLSLATSIFFKPAASAGDTAASSVLVEPAAVAAPTTGAEPTVVAEPMTGAEPAVAAEQATTQNVQTAQ